MNRERFACLILALVTLLLYWPVQHDEFLLLDDPDYVVHNPVVQNGLTWSGVSGAFTSTHASNWHPLTWLSHMLDCQLFGQEPGAPHLVNAILHSANAIFVFLLLARLTGSFWPAIFAAALFAWHPLRVESVAWVAERKDVLSSFFGLLALLSYVRFGQQRERRHFWFALLFFALGLMAKPMLVTLPFVFVLLDHWPLRRTESVSTFKLVMEKWPFVLPAVGSCVITYLAQSNKAVLALEIFPLPLRVANAITSYVAYLWKTVFPTDLAVFYPLSTKISWGTVATCALALALISGLFWQARRTKPYLLLGWLWYLGMLVPVIGLVQVGNQAMADRYTYLPMVGLLLALAYGLRDLNAQNRFGFKVPAAAGGLVLAGCLILTRQQISYWHDNISLFSHAVAVTKDNTLAHIILGTALSKHGQSVEAEAHYREALRLEPLNGLAHQNLASLLDELGRAEAAMSEYREAIRLRPNIPEVYLAYGTRLAQSGKYDDAMQQYALAAQLRPQDPQSYYLMGRARVREGRGLEAIIHFHKALRLDPNHVPTLTYLARLLATDENAEVRNATEAGVMAERANELTHGQQVLVLDTLAAAYAESGHFAEAQQVIQRALSLAASETETTATLQARLKLYQQPQALRENGSNVVWQIEP